MNNIYRRIRLFLDRRGLFRMSDKKFLDMMFCLTLGRNINWNNPRSFNEKLQWLKIHDRRPEYTDMVDKYKVKRYVANKIGIKYIIPTYGLYNNFDEIDFSKLPNQFVIKCTHDSGGVCICKDKSSFNCKDARTKIVKCLRKNYFWEAREWPYKNIKPRIIIEKFIDDGSGELKDYKLFCFNGRPKLVLVCSERFSSNNMCETWFDENWKLLPISENGHRVDGGIRPPKGFERMKKLSSVLSKDIPFVRIDFYETGDEIFFGEMTFFPACGLEKFDPPEWDNKLGDMIELKKPEDCNA